MRQAPRIFYVLTLAFLMSFSLPKSGTAEEITPAIPVKDTVTMVDLGARSCIPCKMMAPILVELEKEYADRAAIVFIDVWKNPDEAKKFKIMAIPTQIFYDQKGQEAFRHLGFMDKKSIVEKLEKLLAKK
ncbi:MAG: thioredoxin family protein [Proteobacteria bacterium]|nr:thioredoxin family protein [Pseudomonadota bacterium]MBU1715389.1 thioredoxin family protein [Pseudomonadota bacterium]